MPPEFAAFMIAFQPLFSKPVFEHVRVLVLGAILAPGRRTVASALRITGRSHLTTFQNYHRVLSRAQWSAHRAAQILLGLLVDTFAEDGPLVFGIDDTIERRYGSKIKAKGIYRDPVRSSKGHFVKASGLRWLSVMLLVRIPWAERIWGLPFLTVLAPSERYHAEQGRRHKKLTDWARQSMLQTKRWLPDRQLVFVGDSSFAALDLLDAVREHVVMVTRLRLDAALYAPAPPRRPGQRGPTPKKGERLPSLASLVADERTVWTEVTASHWYGRQSYRLEIATGTAVWTSGGKPVVPIRWVLVRDPAGKLDPKGFLCTDLEALPLEILSWFVRRWCVEVTFEEVRRHLGVETQRQWSDKAIQRTTPCLLGLFSVVTLLAHSLHEQGQMELPRAAWYRKEVPTFSDALAAVRRRLWRSPHFVVSGRSTETIQIPSALYEHMAEALCYPA